ncbi:MAG: hypothetical protein IPM34_04095 [Saprospiraceae bacterium]|nr:hypothetical protein [Saprospiraceae bacterium]
MWVRVPPSAQSGMGVGVSKEKATRSGFRHSEPTPSVLMGQVSSVELDFEAYVKSIPSQQTPPEFSMGVGVGVGVADRIRHVNITKESLAFAKPAQAKT